MRKIIIRMFSMIIAICAVVLTIAPIQVKAENVALNLTVNGVKEYVMSNNNETFTYKITFTCPTNYETLEIGYGRMFYSKEGNLVHNDYILKANGAFISSGEFEMYYGYAIDSERMGRSYKIQIPESCYGKNIELTVIGKIEDNTIHPFNINEYKFGVMTSFNLISQDGGTQTNVAISNSVAISSDGKALARYFAQRLYLNALERTYDEAGLNMWTNGLASGKYTAAQAVQGFFTSNEFINSGISNQEIVRRCYKTMLDREPDEAGLKYWLDLMNKGASIEELLSGFVNSTEFAKLCDNSNLVRGNISTATKTYVKKKVNRNLVEGFVRRCYTKALGRNAEAGGLKYWTNIIVNSATPRQEAATVATNGFFHSNEFLNKNTKNDEFVKILYRTFLDREAEANGLKYWMNELRNGKSRDYVIQGFADSNEFNNILDSYGF